MSFTPWFFSHNSHHHLIMRKHQAGPPPTPKPPAPTTSPMELLTQRERWETFRKWRDLRCKGTVNFRWTSWARGTTKGCPCGEVHWSPPTCASWVTAAGCTLGSSSTTDSAPCSCWARRASSPQNPRCMAPAAGAGRRVSTHLPCASVCGVALQSLGKALWYIGWWQSTMVATEEHKDLPSLGLAGTGHKGLATCMRALAGGALGACRTTVLRMCHVGPSCPFNAFLRTFF